MAEYIDREALLATFAMTDYPLPNYYPNCGARMDSEG